MTLCGARCAARAACTCFSVRDDACGGPPLCTPALGVCTPAVGARVREGLFIISRGYTPLPRFRDALSRAHRRAAARTHLCLCRT
ncbi:hypothetical protein EON67_07725 [archaeon]|nr:MAG: hypothetical protein EON67_07725 [archaeon]